MTTTGSLSAAAAANPRSNRATRFGQRTSGLPSLRRFSRWDPSNGTTYHLGRDMRGTVAE